MTVGAWFVVPLKSTRRVTPGHFNEYVPTIDIPNGSYFVDDRIQFDPKLQPFIVMKRLTEK